MPSPKVLAFILAGGKGERLYPLTQERSKPAVPFGGKYRLIDFVLSNFVNSNLFSIYVLVQYRSQSLIEYLRMNWRGSGLTEEQFITVVPPQMRLGQTWYMGTADAVRQNLNLLNDFNPDLVAVFGADHIYRMDLSQMIQFHMETEAQVTVAALPVSLKAASRFGILRTDAKGRMTGFEEKPEEPTPIPGDPSHAFASMGNYIFSRDTLVEVLQSGKAQNPDLDFGKNIFPSACEDFKVMAYNFKYNELPGLKSYEEKAYWRDVGSIESYYQANMDLLGDKPRVNLNNPKWFIHSGRYQGPPAKIMDAELSNCIIGDGCLLKRAKVQNSILGRGVHIHENALVKDSIIMDFTKVQAGAKIENAIVDRFNVIPPKGRIVPDSKGDSGTYFRDPSGIAVLPRGKTPV